MCLRNVGIAEIIAFTLTTIIKGLTSYSPMPLFPKQSSLNNLFAAFITDNMMELYRSLFSKKEMDMILYY